MDEQSVELEPEVLSYLAFRNRQALRDWQERRRVHQAREYSGRSASKNKEPLRQQPARGERDSSEAR